MKITINKYSGSYGYGDSRDVEIKLHLDHNHLVCIDGEYYDIDELIQAIEALKKIAN